MIKGQLKLSGHRILTRCKKYQFDEMERLSIHSQSQSVWPVCCQFQGKRICIPHVARCQVVSIGSEKSHRLFGLRTTQLGVPTSSYYCALMNECDFLHMKQLWKDGTLHAQWWCTLSLLCSLYSSLSLCLCLCTMKMHFGASRMLNMVGSYLLGRGKFVWLFIKEVQLRRIPGDNWHT